MREEATGRTIKSRQICSAYFSRPAMKIKIMLPGNYWQHNVVCIQDQIFYHSFMLKEYISLQATCQIFVTRLARLRQSISHSHWFVIHIHVIHPTHNASLLSIIFPSVRLLDIIMSYDHSNFVTELNEFDRLKIRENRNINISICLFIPGSTSQPLSRRVAHHPERLPCSVLFRALRPARLVKSQWPKPRKPNRPSGAAKRL
jgi:hypothetical protein